MHVYSGGALAEASDDESSGEESEPDPSTSASYLAFLQDELVGVDVRLKKDHARIGTVVAVTDGGMQGVAMKVRSGDVEVDLPASSLEAVPMKDKKVSLPVTDEAKEAKESEASVWT